MSFDHPISSIVSVDIVCLDLSRSYGPDNGAVGARRILLPPDFIAVFSHEIISGHAYGIACGTVGPNDSHRNVLVYDMLAQKVQEGLHV